MEVQKVEGEVEGKKLEEKERENKKQKPNQEEKLEIHERLV